MLDYETQAEAANKARLQPRLSAQNVPWEWIDTSGFLEPCVEQAAAACDLIVVSWHCDSFPSPDIDRAVAALIVRAGKPIVAVPDKCRGINVAAKVLIAWDGSEPCFAAIIAAVPLLRRAASVTLLEVDDGSVKRPAREGMAYLAQHGVKATILRCPGLLERAFVPILAEARTGDYAWLVMGGFGHAHFLEALFGGVTRKMLKESPIPLFLAH
jgi:nucleotide-binding universal stress UspA family protein